MYRSGLVRSVIAGALLVLGTLSLGAVGAVVQAAPSASGVTPAPLISVPPPNQLTPRSHASGGQGTQAGVGWSSSNWSGYAETSAAPYSGVSGEWTVPTLTCSGGSQYSAAWLGIDGFNNDSLIQTGTEQDCSNKSASYSAWWTTSAQGFEEQTISTGCSTTGSVSCGTVKPGDVMTATISKSVSATVSASGASENNSSVDSGSGHSIQTLPSGSSPGAPGRSGHGNSGGNGGGSSVSSTTTTISVSPTSTTQGSSVTYSASVKGSTTPTGTVSFTTGSTSLCTATLSGGAGSCTATNAPVGSDSITGTYSGDSSHAGSSGSARLTVTIPASTWALTLSDTTQGWIFTETLSYSGPGASAEWILEAPTVGNRVATLANYGTTEFQLAAIDGGSGNAELTASEGGDMVSGNTIVSIPSAPAGGDAFNIAYGSTAPASP